MHLRPYQLLRPRISVTNSCTSLTQDSRGAGGDGRTLSSAAAAAADDAAAGERLAGVFWDCRDMVS